MLLYRQQGDEDMYFGKQLALMRKQRDLSQEKLARQLYVSRQTISSWENDKTYLDLKSLLILSKIFNKSVDSLVKGDIDQVRYQMMRRKIYWLYISNIFCLILIYLAFTSLHWLPLSISLILMVTFTILGIENTFYLIKFSNRTNLHNVHQIMNYLNGKTSQANEINKRNLWIQYIAGGFLGIFISLLFLFLISKYILDIHF